MITEKVILDFEDLKRQFKEHDPIELLMYEVIKRKELETSIMVNRIWLYALSAVAVWLMVRP